MGLKSTQRLDEGPLDFIRGAGAMAGQKAKAGATAVGQRVANSAPVRAAGDVIQAGRQASQVGEIIKKLKVFAQLVAQFDDAAAQAGTAPVQESTENKDGPMTFASFMSGIHAEQIDEGIWDFMKGAGGAMAHKARETVNKYAERPSVFKDIYQAGKQASAEGNVKKAEAATATAKEQAFQMRDALVAHAKEIGPDAFKALIQKAGLANASRVYNVIKIRARKLGVNL